MTLADLPAAVERLASAGTDASRDEARQAFAALRSALGWLADVTSIETVYTICAFLPALGIFTAWLPDARPAAGYAATDARQARASDT